VERAHDTKVICLPAFSSCSIGINEGRRKDMYTLTCQLLCSPTVSSILFIRLGCTFSVCTPFETTPFPFGVLPFPSALKVSKYRRYVSSTPPVTYSPVKTEQSNDVILGLNCRTDDIKSANLWKITRSAPMAAEISSVLRPYATSSERVGMSMPYTLE
jgi:hypothetical protein